MDKLNIFNCEKSSGDPIVYIFTQTNQNIINIINNNKPASIIRIGGSDYESYINGFNPLIYELNGYLDIETDPVCELENFNKFKNLYIESLKNCDMITVGGYHAIKRFGFIPNECDVFPEKEEEFIITHINDKIPICHWDFINLDFAHNFFFNVFPILDKKRVCIISSFTDDIQTQLLHKDKLFSNKCINENGHCSHNANYEQFKYPSFSHIEYIQVPICINKYKTRQDTISPFRNSLELLEDLYKQISATNAEIYLIGAGAYTNMLCNYIKNEHNRIAINCGSSIQLFFGLLGNRFEYLKKQNVINEYWKYPDLNNCIIYTSKSKMGGFDTDGINAYTWLNTELKKKIKIFGCFKTGTTLIQNIYGINKYHNNIIEFKEIYCDEYENVEIIIFPFRDVNKIYKSAFFQDITSPSYNYSPFYKGNFLDIYADETDDKKKSIINEIDAKLLVDFFNEIKWEQYEHLNCINRINILNNTFNINIDYYSNEVQEFIIDNKKLIVFNIDIFKNYFDKISYSIFGVNNYKYPNINNNIHDIYNIGNIKWYRKKYREFLNLIS